MNKLELQPENNKKNSVLDIASIGGMPEKTLNEISAKKQAYNDLILNLDGQITMVHAESGSNSPDDNSQEETQNEQDYDLLRNAMDRARSEMVRLGDKEELELKKAA